MTTITIEIPEAIATRLAQAAQQRQTSVEALSSSAVEWFVEQETGPLTEVEQLRIENERDGLTYEDAVAEARARRLGMPQYQIEAIRAGLKDMHAGRMVPQEEVFAKIAAKHGW